MVTLLTLFFPTTLLLPVLGNEYQDWFRADPGEELGFDVTKPQPRSFFACMKNSGFKKVLLKIYDFDCPSNSVGEGVRLPYSMWRLTDVYARVVLKSPS